MGLFDKLKKLVQTKEPSEKVSLNSLENTITKEYRNALKEKRNLFLKIKELVIDVVINLENGSSELKKVDLSNSKENERIKSIVKVNLKNYTAYLDLLIDKLKKIEANEYIIEEIDNAFLDFKRKSAVCYQKATYLVGKEIGFVKDRISDFFKEINKTIKLNKDIINKSKIIDLIQEDIIKIKETKEAIQDIKDKIKEDSINQDKIKEQIEKNETEIDKIKKSEKYFNIIKQEKEKSERIKINQELLMKLYTLIDFKTITNIYHTSEKEMSIIKAYKENFTEKFKENEAKDLINLLKESRVYHEEINILLQKIIQNKKEINSIQIEETELEKIKEEINNLNIELEKTNINKSLEKKRIDKSNNHLEELSKELKEKLLKINVELTD